MFSTSTVAFGHVLLDFLVLGIVSFVVLFSIGLALRFCPPVLGLPLLVVAQGYCQSLNRALAAGWEASCKYVAALLLLGGAAYLVHGAFLEAGGSPWQVKRGSELLFFGFLASPDQPILLTLVNCSLPAYQGVDYSKSRLRIAPLLRPLEKVMLVANSICLTASFVSNILLFSTQDARYSPKDLRVLQAIACVQLFLTSVVVSVLHLLPRCLKDAHSYWMPLGSAAGGSSHLPQHHASSSHHASANRAPPRPSASVPPSPAPPMLAASVVDVAEHYEYVQHILARGQSVSQGASISALILCISEIAFSFMSPSRHLIHHTSYASPPPPITYTPSHRGAAFCPLHVHHAARGAGSGSTLARPNSLARTIADSSLRR